MTITPGEQDNYGKVHTDTSIIRFNPPISGLAASANIFQSPLQTSQDPWNGRNEILGSDSLRSRQIAKGVLYQDTDTLPSSDSATSAFAVNSDSPYATFRTQDAVRYGFKFHYNPSTITFDVNATNSTIDPGLILSGQSRAMPIAPPNLPLIGFSLVINRIEDFSLLGPRGSASDAAGQKYYYGRQLQEEEITGLITRGTGYDMEFLFRTLLGRPYETDLRGKTADIGITFGLPLILDFSPKNLPYDYTSTQGTISRVGQNQSQHGQRYWGRVSSISYTHREFTRTMVPMFTEVTVNFARFPDAKGERRDAQDTSDPNSRGRQAEAARLQAQADAAAAAAGNTVANQPTNVIPYFAPGDRYNGFKIIGPYDYANQYYMGEMTDGSGFRTPLYAENDRDNPFTWEVEE